MGEIKCDTKSKILGHIMNTDNNMNEAIQDRLLKSNNARVGIKNPYIANKEIDTRLRLTLYDTIIGSILLYSMHITPLNKNNIL